MSNPLERLTLNPVEFTPELPEIDLSALGIAIGAAGFNYGESSIQVERVKQAIGEGVTSAHWPSVDCEGPLIVSSDPSVTQAAAFKPVETFVSEVQRRKTRWIRRDFADAAGFSGSVATFVDAAGITTPKGKGHVDEITLKLSRYPFWFATVEEESEEFSASEVRELEFTLAEMLGTVPGLIKLVIENEGEEDWRGCLASLECEDYSDAPTAKPHYSAKDLTLQGGSVVTATAAPEVRAVGAIASGTAQIAPALPAGTEDGDLLLMVAESGGTTAGGEATPALTAAGWAEPLNHGSVKRGNTRLTVLYRIATGGDPTTTNDTGDHQLARIIGIKAGTFDPVEPFNNVGIAGQSATKAVSILGIETYRDNCLIVACASGNLPDSNTSAEFSAVTNASLTSLTERIDNTTAEGDGGAIFAATGVKAAAGAYGATTVTAVTEAERAVLSLAVNPPAVVKCPPLNSGVVPSSTNPCWVTVLSSEIDGKGHMTHAGPRRLMIRLEDPHATPDAESKLEWRALGSAAWMQTQEGSTPIIKVSPVVGDYQLIDMGGFTIPEAITGDQRWEFRMQMRSATGSGVQPLIRDVYPMSTEQWMRVANANPDPIDGEPSSPPGTVEDATGVGTLTWSTPGNATVPDGSCATCQGSGEKANQSHYLKATNFGFSLPSWAIIRGISFTVRRRSSLEAAAQVADGRARVVKGGVVKEAVDHALPEETFWPRSFANAAYGGPSDLWGQAWTAADINSSTFGFAFSAWSTHLFAGSSHWYGKAEVDSISATVTYAESANPEAHICVAERSLEFSDTGVRRQHPTDEVWGDLIEDGFLPYAPPAGQAGRSMRGLVIPSVGDFAERADSAATTLSAKVIYRPAYLFAREVAE